jgi:hypothetical protein
MADFGSESSGGYGIEGGGGYGGYGGAYGGGSFADSPGFGNEGYGSQWDTEKDFQDIQAQVQDIVDNANKSAAASEIQDYAIPGPLNPRDIERAPPEDQSRAAQIGGYLKNKFTNWAKGMPVRVVGNVTQAFAPPLVAPATLITRVAMAKAMGVAPEEIDRMAATGMFDIMTGGMFTGIQALGKGTQNLSKALGAKGGPQPGSGEQAAGPGVGVEDMHAAVERARETGELTRTTTPPELLRDAKAARV